MPILLRLHNFFSFSNLIQSIPEYILNHVLSQQYNIIPFKLSLLIMMFATVNLCIGSLMNVHWGGWFIGMWRFVFTSAFCFIQRSGFLFLAMSGQIRLHVPFSGCVPLTVVVETLWNYVLNRTRKIIKNSPIFLFRVIIENWGDFFRKMTLKWP